jgi:hypothetical protein
MKKYFIIIFIIGNISFSQSLLDAQSIYCESDVVVPAVSFNQCDNNPWILVFEEEFNGNSLDESMWKIPYQGVLRNFSFNNTKQWYANSGNTPALPTSNNIVIENGALKIITRRENPPIHGYYTNWDLNPPNTVDDYFDYSSGEIETKWKFSYGLIEGRIKIPKGRGFAPAFWTFGSDPVWNELDIFEFYNEYKLVLMPSPHWQIDYDKLSKKHLMTIHYDYNSDNNDDFCASDYLGPDYSSIYYNYKIDWETNKTEWFVNDISKRNELRYLTSLGQDPGCNINAYNTYLKNRIYTLSPMTIILGMGIQHGVEHFNVFDNGGVNREPDANTVLPCNMEVDYVRYYQRHPYTDVNISNISGNELQSELYNVVAGKSVIINCNYLIEDGFFLKVLSESNIILKPGFHSKTGSTLIATINPQMYQSSKSSLKSNNFSAEQSDSSEQDISGVKSSMKNSTFNNDIAVKPNPCNDFLTISFGSLNSNDFNLVIFSVFGSKVNIKNESVNSKEITLDITELDSGFYIIKIINKYNNTTVTKKVLVE